MALQQACEHPQVGGQALQHTPTIARAQFEPREPRDTPVHRGDRPTESLETSHAVPPTDTASLGMLLLSKLDGAPGLGTTATPLPFLDQTWCKGVQLPWATRAKRVLYPGRTHRNFGAYLPTSRATLQIFIEGMRMSILCPAPLHEYMGHPPIVIQAHLLLLVPAQVGDSVKQC